ncbi:hypothetical protein FDP41_004014 [Naegleria fowleri]|uniref:Alpha 1,4-glycosyltransferase domain-containing protein n=1 Tax=Naegleria fowleri TaxID=5763 RepID=A0A6A5BUX2_NAEFO|nr:uncharacterized protein FDP41_004014 [Naegleria fowleri]KAF0976719.1 hypothetical protein FDP41_004014 [Naegleria fowleri]
MVVAVPYRNYGHFIIGLLVFVSGMCLLAWMRRKPAMKNPYEKDFIGKHKCSFRPATSIRYDPADDLSNRIPQTIIQTYKPSSIEKLPESMKKAMNSFKILNPNYTHKYFGDDAALNILIEHFGNDSDEVFAFRNLIPGAFKIDFWRYAMLWLFGGFYADADMLLMEPFEKWISPNASFVIPLEKIGFGFHNGFIGSVPQHPIMRIAMDMVIYNVKHKFYPGVPTVLKGQFRVLAVSGPVLLGKAINRYLNEPDEVVHNLPLMKEKRIQVIGFCATSSKEEDIYYTDQASSSTTGSCQGNIVARVKYPEFMQENEEVTKSKHYDLLFQAKKVFA